MRTDIETGQPSHVTALFDDGALSFALPKGATLEDLAERLAVLDGRELLTVSVRLDS